MTREKTWNVPSKGTIERSLARENVFLAKIEAARRRRRLKLRLKVLPGEGGTTEEGQSNLASPKPSFYQWL
jgi:hypothetical protein